MKCENKLKWVHNSSKEKFTHYTIHEKRGQEAINSIGILIDYKGTSPRQI